LTVNFWAIADTHLSFAKPRDMARFGSKWASHEETIAAYWRASIAPDDVVLIPGDVSWASAPNKVLPDLAWLTHLPGHKVLLRGNHDHWWSSIERARKIAEPLGFQLLEGDSITLAGVVICGAMGHVAPEDPYYKPDPPKNRYERELARLESALKHGAQRRAPGQPMILIMHYPPFTSEGKPSAYSNLIAQYRPDVCLYGHLHRSAEWKVAVNEARDGIEYRLVAADFIEMKPQLVWKSEV
jgi:uncharacterized protein